ncbi:MAG: oligosaccharide flippase family protein [Bacteroidota bacterium]
MSTLKKLASQTAVYGLSQILGRFVNYLLVPLYTSIFTTGEYGVVTLMYSYVTFFNVLLTYGMETAFFRFSQKQEQPGDVYATALKSLLVTSSGFILLFCFLSSPIAALIKLPEHPEYIVYFTIIIALDAVAALPFAYLRQQNRPIKFALIKNISIFSNILLNLYFLVLCPYAVKNWGTTLPFYEAEIGIGYIFISNLVSSIIPLPLLAKEFMEMRGYSFNKVLWREMLVYALPMMVIGFAGMINETLDRTIITYFYDDPEVGRSMNGIYGANYKLSILMSLFIQAFRYAAEPFFFSHAQTTDKRTIYAQVMDYFVLVCLCLFLGVMLFMNVFQHFIGPNFREGLHIVPILLIANMFLGIYYNLSIWYKLSDQTNKGAKISLVGAAITIGANIILIPLLGYTGAAWATLICYVSMAVMCYWMGAKYYPIPYNTGKVLLFIAVALVLYFVHQWLLPFLPQSPLVQNLIHGLFLLIFIVFAWLFERNNKVLFSPR